MRFLLLLLFTTFYSNSSVAQDTAAGGNRNQAVYLELLGNGLIGSVNYDMRLSRGRQDGHGIRVGLGGFPVRGWDNTGQRVTGAVVALPLAYNYLFGQRRSAFEAGAGITPLFGRLEVAELSGEKLSKGDVAFIGFLNAGYRYQPLNSGFVFRFTWTPAISGEGFSPLWFGLSLGYGFK